MKRFPLSYNRPMRLLLAALGLGPRRAWVAVDTGAVEVRMGWGFLARFPATAVRRVEPGYGRRISQGIHGRRGTWRVNGSSEGLVQIYLAPGQHARALGREVTLDMLEISVADPDALIVALAHASEPDDGH